MPPRRARRQAGANAGTAGAAPVPAPIPGPPSTVLAPGPIASMPDPADYMIGASDVKGVVNLTSSDDYRLWSAIYLLTATAAGLATGSTYGDKELIDTRENITHENYHGEFQKAVMGELSQYPHTPTHIEEYDQKPQSLETFQTVWTKSPHEARCGPSGEDSVITELGPHVTAHRIVKEKMKTSTNYLYGSIGVMVLNFLVGGFVWSLHLAIQRFEIALLVQEEHLGRDIDLEKIRDNERGIK